MYDGIDGPPRLLAPAAVAEIARALYAVDLDDLMADLPSHPKDAAAACGFGREFAGDVRDYLIEHFTAMREFYGGATRRGQCMVMWTD
ncbi:DUF1877 family protein [Streptomyces sp. MS1.AVA.1]|uniref:DUF1877 family protein n=1 Tax=Streptomyces machairae TaxID=3134109 RepID=A0ABU8UJW8_9ACTN